MTPRKSRRLRGLRRAGRHRGPTGERTGDEIAARGTEDAQDAELLRVLAYTGLCHAKLTTTEPYMHAKARRDDLARLDRAFAPAHPPDLQQGLQIEP